jgi:hypothetical protein
MSVSAAREPTHQPAHLLHDLPCEKHRLVLLLIHPVSVLDALNNVHIHRAEHPVFQIPEDVDELVSARRGGLELIK